MHQKFLNQPQESLYIRAARIVFFYDQATLLDDHQLKFFELLHRQVAVPTADLELYLLKFFELQLMNNS